jgi:thiamine biosynthesis lipoprotein
VTATASFPALGTTARVVVPHRRDLLRARGILAAQLEELDRACSRFRPDSELSRANACAGDWVQVTPLLAEAVDAALTAARATDGLVDPTLGAQLRAAGYDRTFTLVEAREGWSFAPAPRRSTGWMTVELEGDRLRVPHGCELDLGATAKALAADRAARTIGAGALVSLGGDIAIAGNREWSIRVAERHDAPLDGDGPCVALRGGGIATSSTTARRWRTDRGEAHHLIDPRTGMPAQSCWRTVTVAAASCVEANVAATAAIVLGDAAVGWLRDRSLASRLVGTDGGVVHVCGWPAEAEAA